MKIPKYIQKMILYREKLQLKSNEIQSDIEKWFEKHNIFLHMMIEKNLEIMKR